MEGQGLEGRGKGSCGAYTVERKVEGHALEKIGKGRGAAWVEAGNLERK